MGKFTVTDNKKERRFEVKDEGSTAFLQYEMKGSNIALLHTEVPEDIGGKGVADALASSAFEYAKENTMKVISYCAFIDAYVKRHPDPDIMITEKEN